MQQKTETDKTESEASKTSRKRSTPEYDLIKDYLKTQTKEQHGKPSKSSTKNQKRILKNTGILIVDSIMMNIRRRLLSGDTIILPGVGRLFVEKRHPKKYFNRFSGQIEESDEGFKVVFRPNSSLLRALSRQAQSKNIC